MNKSEVIGIFRAAAKSTYDDLMNNNPGNLSRMLLKSDKNSGEKIYNTEYSLEGDQIKAGALMMTQELIAKRSSGYISLEEAGSFFDVCDVGAIDGINKEMLMEFYGTQIKNSIKDNKPLFFPFTDGHHHTLIAILPGSKQVIYANSLKSGQYSNVGLNFAKDLLAGLQEKDPNFKGTDISKDQQHGNACGLAVATNMALITDYYYNDIKKKDIQNVLCDIPINEKEPYYRDLGSSLVEKLERMQKFAVNSEKFKKTMLKVEKLTVDKEDRMWGPILDGEGIISSLTFAELINKILLKYPESKNIKPDYSKISNQTVRISKDSFKKLDDLMLNIISGGEHKDAKSAFKELYNDFHESLQSAFKPVFDIALKSLYQRLCKLLQSLYLEVKKI